MAESAPPPSSPAPEAGRGPLAEVLGFIGSLGGHLQALLALAGLEGREAAARYLVLGMVLGAGAVFAVFGYLLFVIFVAFALQHLLGVSWIWIFLGLAVIHLLAALVCFLIVRRGIRAPAFVATAEELRKDLEALQNFKP